MHTYHNVSTTLDEVMRMYSIVGNHTKLLPESHFKVAMLPNPPLPLGVLFRRERSNDTDITEFQRDLFYAKLLSRLCQVAGATHYIEEYNIKAQKTMETYRQVLTSHAATNDNSPMERTVDEFMRRTEQTVNDYLDTTFGPVTAVSASKARWV